MNANIGLHVDAVAHVEYGTLRRSTAAYFNIDPADVTHDHVSQFQIETGGDE